MKNNYPVSIVKNPNKLKKDGVHKFDIISSNITREVTKFHKKLPGFKISPLKGLNKLSDFLGLGGIWVKDESERLSLNSFKILGSSYAIYKYIKKKLKLKDEDNISFAELISNETQNKIGSTILATATDGNHGRGVAWAANKLGMKAVVYVHKTTSKARINAIKKYGADVKIINGTYDEAVEKLKIDAKNNNWTIISDTSWKNYKEIPIWVMQGYSTIYNEIQNQLMGIGIIKPTHIFVQAGVGSLAASLVNYYTNLFKKDAPKIIIVEPSTAGCIFKSVLKNQPKPMDIKIKTSTIMAGLECGNPNPIAWDILKWQADYFCLCPDYVAAKGMRVYSIPLEGDPLIISGESGAVTLGALMFIMENPDLKKIKEELKLDIDSQILLINTEGNTDPVNFRKIVWEGLDSVPEKYRNHNL